MYLDSRSVASWVTLSQLIGWGGGAFDTPIDSDGRMLGVAGGAAKAEPERATQASIHAAAIATVVRRRKVAFEDARFDRAP